MIVARNTDAAAQRARAQRMRAQVRLENTFAREVKPILAEQVLGAAVAIVAGADFARAVDAQAPRLATAYGRQYVRAASAFAPDLIRMVTGNGGKKAAQENDLFARQAALAEARGATAEAAFWTRYGAWARTVAAQHVKEASAFTKRVIRGEIARGATAGLSNRDIARGILDNAGLKPIEGGGRGLLDVARRATTIARTETHTAASASVQEAAKSTGVPMRRRWVAANDARTRPEHRKANGQERAMDKPFSVGGEALMYPGDPAGSGAMTIQCRCILTYSRVRGAVTKPKPLARSPQDAVSSHPVASQFVNPEHGKRYLEHERKYEKWFEEKGITTRPVADAYGNRMFGREQTDAIWNLRTEECPTLNSALNSWQGDPSKQRPMTFKHVALRMEKQSGKRMTHRLWGNSDHLADVEKLSASPEIQEEYIRLRAMNQAYMKRMGIKKVKLYRGTDGRTGEALRKAFEDASKTGELPKTLVIEDDVLAGYADEKRIADHWGERNGGITIVREVKAEDVVLHSDLLSGVTHSFAEEHEFIVLGGPRNIAIKDIYWTRPRSIIID